MIYQNMNRLTSLCYPEYKGSEMVQFESGADVMEVGAIGQKTRMKPLLVKFRLGDLFGGGQQFSPERREMTGFLKSLSYTVPDESPWEIKSGYRVPKYISADIGFQVIHSEVPSLAFAKIQTEGTTQNSFYGINHSDKVGFEAAGET